MYWKGTFLACLAWVVVVANGKERPTVFAVGPNVFRLDTEETVSLVLSERRKSLPIDVYLLEHPYKNKTYSKKHLDLKPYEATIVKLKISSSELADLKFVEEQKSRYIYLVVKSTDPAFKFVRETTLLVQSSSGHVFIQTDKPIYNPRQTVYIRVLPVDQQMKLTNIPVRLEILNPQGSIVDRKELSRKEKFINYAHTVVDRPVVGNWTIRASYGKDFKSNSTVQFEVREYLLPTFEVKIRPHVTNYILPSTRSLEGSVSARYVFDKPVKGFVYLRFYVDFLGKMHTLPTLRKGLNDHGEASFGIDLDELLAPLGVDGHPEGGRLIVTADVTERATFHTETKTDRNSMFVRSPYVLQLTRSSKYMKPGLPYLVRIDGRFFGGGPVKGLSVEITAHQKRGNKVIDLKSEKVDLDEAGQANVQMDVLRNIESVDITATTSDDKIHDDYQATITHTVKSYYSPSKTYIQVHPKQDTVAVGEQLTLEILATKMDDISALNAMVISRGHVVYSKTLNRDAGFINTLNIPVTPDMVPSIRVVAYYINNKHNREIVADSVWVDVEDSCSEEVIIKPIKDTYEPDSLGHVTLTGEPGSLVGVSMVDSAVFLLNDRHILSRKKMFDTMETFDLGCGLSGGKDASGVFFESGLSVVTTAQFTNKVRENLECQNAAHSRKRREAKVSKAELHKQMCCRSGSVILNDTSCYERADAFVNATSMCKQEFYRCCKLAAACRNKEEGCSKLGRSGGVGGDALNLFDYVDEKVNINFRDNFPESTLLEDYIIGKSGEKRIEVTLPSSITKWVIQGISVSPTSGMCVSKTANLTVFKNFFLDVRLPVKAVRGEQLEVKVTVYNYAAYQTTVHVYMYGTEGICSEARAGKKTPRRLLTVKGNDAVSTSYPIIPLKSIDYTIKVEAYSAFGSDGVEKILHVVPEGKHIIKEFTIPLDPQGRLEGNGAEPGVQNDGNFNEHGKTYSQELKVPSDIIENTAKCSAVVTGTVMGHSVEAVITGLENMLQVPRGCGEQTMIRMAPTVYAMAYLTHTNPNKKGIEGNGYKYIQQGYSRELKYRKPDGSFAVWAHYPSSTWLTAFVLKVFCQAREFADIDPKVISSGFEWLQKQQTATGQYKDPYKVHHREMIGAVKDGVTLTAFVLIALRECYEGRAGKAPGEEKAVEYLEKELDSLQSPYALSLVTYALALADSERKDRANEMLQDKAVYDKDKSTRYWSETKIGKKATALAVETTGYALLSQLKLDNVGYTHAIVNWLLQQRNSKGAFKSTQDTVVGLQAITSYSIRTFVEDLDMNCDLTSEADGHFHTTVKLQQRDAEVQQPVKHIPIGGKLFVHAKGTGVGLLHVKLDYNIPNEDDELCKFKLTVNCEDVQFVVNKRNCDVCNQDCKEEEVNVLNLENDDYYDDVDLYLPEARRAQESFAKIGPRRSRVGRQAKIIKHGGSKPVVCIHVCASSLTGKDTGLSIIDVGIFTGLKAIEEDLEKLKTDEVIQNFETIGERVILYMEKIPSHDENSDPLCVKFRARQDFVVGNVQPQTVKVYDYYEPTDVACTQFYRPQELSGLYKTLCEDGVCTCAEGRCSKQYTDEERWALRKQDLMVIACTEADYVYSVKIVRIEKITGKGLVQRKVTADLVNLIKPGGDSSAVQGGPIEFWIVDTCFEPQLEISRIYLVMGKDGKISADSNMKYRLDDTAFVMEFHSKYNRKLPRNDRLLGHRMEKLEEALEHGCPGK